MKIVSCFIDTIEVKLALSVSPLRHVVSATLLQENRKHIHVFGFPSQECCIVCVNIYKTANTLSVPRFLLILLNHRQFELKNHFTLK